MDSSHRYMKDLTSMTNENPLDLSPTLSLILYNSSVVTYSESSYEENQPFGRTYHSDVLIEFDEPLVTFDYNDISRIKRFHTRNS